MSDEPRPPVTWGDRIWLGAAWLMIGALLTFVAVAAR